jgi:hypothetical protein
MLKEGEVVGNLLLYRQEIRGLPPRGRDFHRQ